jgi:prepilin-type processing-associated H-X9-DG protein
VTTTTTDQTPLTRRTSGPARGFPPVLCVASGKGGVGKTSLALCLAREIARSARVLVIDLDYFNRGATSLLREETQPFAAGLSLIEVLPLYSPSASGEAPRDSDPPLRVDQLRRHESMLFCPCPDLSQPIIRGLHDRPIRELAASLRGLIAWICLAHDVGCVVIDAHGGPDPLSFAACEIADHTVLVTEPDKVTLHGALNFLAILRSYAPGPLSGKLHLVFNRVSPHFSYRGIEQVYQSDLADLFGTPLLAMIPFDDQIFDSFGQTPLSTDLFPNSTFARKIELIVRRLLLPDQPALVTPEVTSWSPAKEQQIHRRLEQWDLARPASIAILWLVTMLALFLITTSAAFDALGNGPLYVTVMWSAGITAVASGLLALVSSFTLVARNAARNLRFARNTPLQQLYSVKVAMNGALLLLMSGFILLGVVLPLLSAINSAREAARRAQCVNNLHQISLALANYASANGCLPAAVVADKDGKPMYGWRVTLLGYMEQNLLYNAYNFALPWYAAANETVGNAGINLYHCPSDTGARRYEPSYVMVTRPDTTFQPSKALGLSISKITDGTRNSLIVVETTKFHHHWMEPADLSAETMRLTINGQPPSISSRHPGGANVSFADGSVKFLKDSLNSQMLRALISPSGNEPISSDSF